MTDRKQFFMNGTLLTAVMVAMRTVGLFFSSYVSGAVGAEGIGLYTLLMTVYGFSLTFATAGISLTVTRLVAGAKDEREVVDLCRGAFLYAAAFGAVSFSVLFFFSPVFAEAVLSDARCAAPLRILAFSLMPEAISAVYVGYFVGVRRVAGNAMTQVLAQLCKITFTVLAVSRFATDAESACLCLSAVSVGTDAVGFLILTVRFFWDRRNWKKTGGKTLFPLVAKEVFPLALSAYIRSALLTAEHTLIPICLVSYGQTMKEALASYGVLHGMTLPLLLYPMAMLTSFSGLLVPEFAEARSDGNRARMVRIAKKAIESTLIYGVAVCVFLCFFSEELGFRLYHSYEAGYYLLRMAPILPLMYLDHVTDAMLKGIGEHVYSMWVNISDAALSVLLVWLLLPKLGIGGYALVIVLMETYNFSLSFLRLRRRIPVHVSVVRVVVCPLLAALVSVWLTKLLFPVSGDAVVALWLGLRMLFACCCFYVLYRLFFLGKIIFSSPGKAVAERRS